MYKTAVITDEISQDLEVAARLARQYGLDGLEIRSVNEKNPFEMSMEDFRQVRRIADDHGLRICAMGAPLFKCALDDRQTRQAHVEAFKRAMEALQLWDAKLIRGFTFLNLHDGEKRFGEVADAFAQLIPIAEENGVTIVIESEPSVYTSNIASLIRFLELLGSASVRALFDPGNEIVDEQAPPPYPDGYQRLWPYLAHVHVKDILRSPGSFIPAMLGEGSVDFDGIFGALKQGYDGWVSVETHYRVTEGVSAENLLHPQGSSFSKGGYEATVRYLDRLRDRYHWMERV